jgi:hypothetical protein
MRRRKALPLYDRRWVLLTEAHAEHAKRIVSGVRAAREYIELLRNGGIRSMLQRDYPERYYGPPAPVRTQLSELYWEVYEPVYSGSGPLRIYSRALTNRSVLNYAWDLQLNGYTFFVWGPDLKNFFGWDTALTKQQQQMTEVPMKSGRTPVHDYAELAAVAMVLILRKSKTNQAPILNGLRKWCGDNEKKVPPESTLKDIANTALRVAERLK